MLGLLIWVSLDIGNLKIVMKLVEHLDIWLLKYFLGRIIPSVLISMLLESLPLNYWSGKDHIMEEIEKVSDRKCWLVRQRSQRVTVLKYQNRG